MSPIDPEKVITTIQGVLDWCRSKANLRVPGEGGERALRGRLTEALLEKTLGWPPESILPGERFDISLLNTDDQPVITIETKEPSHVTTAGEYKTFLGRLRRYPSLRHAYITNGSYWERFDLLAPIPEQEEVTEDAFEDAVPGQAAALFEDARPKRKLGWRFEFNLSPTSSTQIREFFGPLDAAHYHDLTKRLPLGVHRHRLVREEPQFIEGFGAALRDSIAEFRDLFIDLFQRFRTGELGREAAEVSRSSFHLWCNRSYVVPPGSLHKQLESELQKQETSVNQIISLLTTDFGFAAEASTRVAEALIAERRKRGSNPERRVELLWPLYEQAIANYSTQTAHVCVARLLLYRIGEDQKVFEESLSGPSLQRLLTPAEKKPPFGPRSDLLSRVESLRAGMAPFAPTVYESGEFDWWRTVHPDVLTDAERERLQPLEQDLEVAYERLLRRLNLYDFGLIDLDIWRDIYQHYLPEEERQKLGGFYTPQELVDLLLDYAGYRPGEAKLCEKSLIDLASGSGAFVVSALQRLLAHLTDKGHACHSSLHGRELTQWERAQTILQIVAKNIHAIDIHPFAAFLTYINFLFAVLPLYAVVQEHRTGFRLAAAVFSGNSLLTPGQNAGQRELDLAANSRIQLSQYARERYREMAARKFDFVVGNPPWGGILKGRLAPIFDEQYKRQLANEFPDTYTGKLDIYALFYSRGLNWLKPGGTLALVTQGSFVDKDWAGPHTDFIRGDRVEIIGLRRKLAEHATLRYLIDLNPFGQLFFGAMNIPCIGIFEKRPPYEDENAIVLLSSKKSWPKGMTKADRRKQVITMARQCLELVQKSGEPLKQDFISAFPFPVGRLRQFQGGRWLLAPKDFKIRATPDWPRAAQLLEPSQGVTVGGEDALSIFLMPEQQAKKLGLENPLVHRIIKGHETKPWRVEWAGNVILYPYHKDQKGQWQPAFTCHKPPVLDALDFEHPADKFEQDWVRQHGRNAVSYNRLLAHRRDALNLVKYPKAAEYLLQSYEQLSGRTFKKRNVRDFGREWYEFIWPRDAEVVFGQPKIISPRLTPKVRFALDQEGIGIQDSCLCLAVSDNTRDAYSEFGRRLSKLMGHDLKLVTIFKYLLAFLNSSYSQELLTTGHRPRPGDVFQISDEFLRELSIPVPTTKREFEKIIEAVDACTLARTDKAREPAELKANNLALAIYEPD